MGHPREAARLAWTKLVRTWSITPNAAGYDSPLIKAVAWLSVGPEFALSLVGMWLLRRRPAVLLLLLAPAFYFTLMHMIFVGSVRYRVPAMPLIFVLAATAVVAGWRRVSPPHNQAAIA
jgi:hypothetical protein